MRLLTALCVVFHYRVHHGLTDLHRLTSSALSSHRFRSRLLAMM